MELLTLCPFHAGVALWETASGQPWITVVVKGTFSLVPGGAAAIAAAAAQAPIEPGDLVPTKPGVDVLLVGHAHAPRSPRASAAPVTSLVARLRVGELDKAILVRGDQRWVQGAAGLDVSAPEPFTAMPLRHERAARTTDNPVGIDAAAPPVAGALARPNLHADRSSSAAFAPIARAWPARRRLVSDAALAWADAVTSQDGPAGRAPEGFDFAYFCAAPADQRLRALPAGAPIALDHLHPEHARFEGRLPVVTAQAFYAVSGGAEQPAEIPLRCDTVWIDADRALVVLTWRGLLDARSTDPGGAIVLAADLEGGQLSPERIAATLRDSVPDARRAPIHERAARTGGAPPHARATVEIAVAAPSSEALPFQPAADPSADVDVYPEDLELTHVMPSGEDLDRLGVASEPAATTPVAPAIPVVHVPFDTGSRRPFAGTAPIDPDRDVTKPALPFKESGAAASGRRFGGTAPLDPDAQAAPPALPFIRRVGPWIDAVVVDAREEGRVASVLDPAERDEDVEQTVSIVADVPGAPAPLPFGRAAARGAEERDEDAEQTVSIVGAIPGAGLPFSPGEGDAEAIASIVAAPAPVVAAPPAAPVAAAPPAAPIASPAIPADPDLDEYAAIKAALWAGGVPRAEVLARHGLTDAAWIERERRQLDAVAEEARHGHAGRALALRDAVAAALQDPEIQGAPLSLDEYAALRAALEIADDVAPVLSAHGLTLGAWRGIDRDMRRRALADPNLREALRQHLVAARAAKSRDPRTRSPDPH